MKKRGVIMQAHECDRPKVELCDKEILMRNAIVIEVDGSGKFATSYGTFESEGMVVSDKDNTKKQLFAAIEVAAKQMDKVIGEITNINIPDVAEIEVKKVDGEMTTVYSYKANVSVELK